MIKSIIIIYIIYLNYLYAGIGDAMNKYWNDISNSNNNSAVGDQRAGYYSGGSYRARVPIVKHNLVDFAPPRFSAGCNGIDMFMGSFSHINTDQFIKFAKAIPANAI
jgi:conjugative transfer pilus assembly protein TraH